MIYYLNDEQQQQAQQAMDALKADGINVVTELSPAPTFYPAEDYHQNFFAKNPTQGYCNFAIPPKLNKLRSKFTTLLKPIKFHENGHKKRLQSVAFLLSKS